jgi:hypothetical protein
MNDQDLTQFAERHTAAWCSQNAASVAGFLAPDGSLTIKPPHSFRWSSGDRSGRSELYDSLSRSGCEDE